MSKTLTNFTCSNCQNNFTKWQGKCNFCGAWNSIKKSQINFSNVNINLEIPQSLAEIPQQNTPSIWKTGVHELDRVLGQGIAYQSIGLLGGAPGIGKSTLILQVLGRLTKLDKKVFYVTGEESALQIKNRAERLAINQEKIFILVENSLENILSSIGKLKPDFVVIDSIQTIASNEASGSAGGLSQVRECTMKILQYSKQLPTTFLLVGHITKDGNLAGPKVLEHMVDYVLYLEEENTQGMKILKAVKNRFGSIYDSGLFRMTNKGLVEVSQPNKSLLLEKTLTAGTAYYPMHKGNRTLLIEIQALVGKNSHLASLKTAIGIERSKLLLLLAVLDKYLNINLLQNDVYVNIAGGYRCSEPSIDLSILAAILSSYKNKPLPNISIFLGEIALTGKLSINNSWKDRLKEVERCGFEKAFLGKIHTNQKKISFGKLQVLANDKLVDFAESLGL